MGMPKPKPWGPAPMKLSPSEAMEKRHLASLRDSEQHGMTRAEENRMIELEAKLQTPDWDTYAQSGRPVPSYADQTIPRRGGMPSSLGRERYAGHRDVGKLSGKPGYTVGFSESGLIDRPPAKMTQSGWEEYPSGTEQYNQQFGQRQSDIDARSRQNQPSAEDAAKAQAQQQAAIRQSQLADLDRRIEFERDNPLIERRRSASGRSFEAISPGQTYVVAEGADRLGGKFERMPFISREAYDQQRGESSGRVLGRGKVRPKGVLGEDEETLGQPTLLGG